MIIASVIFDSNTHKTPTTIRLLPSPSRQLHVCTSTATEAQAQHSLKRTHQQANSNELTSRTPPLPSNVNTTLAIIQEVLKLAFKLYPRVVLSHCLKAFKGEDKASFQAGSLARVLECSYSRSHVCARAHVRVHACMCVCAHVYVCVYV